MRTFFSLLRIALVYELAKDTCMSINSVAANKVALATWKCFSKFLLPLKLVLQIARTRGAFCYEVPLETAAHGELQGPMCVIQALSVMQLRLEAPSQYTEFKALLLPLSVLFAVPRLTHILAKKVKTLDGVEL
ncbi:hypothetical protein EDD85DRAFT_441762 [Armillaria nabsnona]|nr:hypothetical protein EDD85DRAFT_441762 [Armillaria nabsnona]